MLVMLLVNCTKNNVNPDPIPDVPVTITVNMSNPSHSHLLDAGSISYETGGVKGVVIVHSLIDDQFYAFDRCCSYKPNDACSRVELDSSGFQFRCGESKLGGFVNCCSSRFSMEGQVASGPATYVLKQYQVIRSGNLLNIKN